MFAGRHTRRNVRCKHTLSSHKPRIPSHAHAQARVCLLRWAARAARRLLRVSLPGAWSVCYVCTHTHSYLSPLLLHPRNTQHLLPHPHAHTGGASAEREQQERACAPPASAHPPADGVCARNACCCECACVCVWGGGGIDGHPSLCHQHNSAPDSAHSLRPVHCYCVRWLICICGILTD